MKMVELPKNYFKQKKSKNAHGGTQHGKQKHWSVHSVNSWVTTFRDQSQAQTKNAVDDEVIEKTRVGQS